MSSLRNAVKRKTHKERSQPSGRKKFGLLEKRKDYQLRAKDFARKKKRLDSLRRKAEFRNEDEFYYGMTNTQTKQGLHVVHREGPDYQASLLAENFDKGYLQSRLVHEKHQLDKLQANLHFIGVDASRIDASNSSKHTVFVDDEEEAENFDEAEYLDTAPELVNVPAHLRPTIEELKQKKKNKSQKIRGVVSSEVQTEKGYAELLRRNKRVQALSNAVQHLDTKQNLRGKGKRRKVSEAGDGKPARYVWQQERAR